MCDDDCCELKYVCSYAKKTFLLFTQCQLYRVFVVALATVMYVDVFFPLLFVSDTCVFMFVDTCVRMCVVATHPGFNLIFSPSYTLYHRQNSLQRCFETLSCAQGKHTNPRYAQTHRHTDTQTHVLQYILNTFGVHTYICMYRHATLQLACGYYANVKCE